jgi:peroxiredoxin
LRPSFSVVGLLLAGLLASVPAAVSAAPATPAATGSAIDFTLRTLDGKSVTLSQHKGKVVLVNFWATSCVSCVKEMPQIVATHQRFKARGFETLAVAMSYDPPAYVANFAQTRQLPFGVVIDNTGAIARAFNDTQITPTTFLIDKRGAIVKRYVGEPDFAELGGLVEKLLAEA